MLLYQPPGIDFALQQILTTGQRAEHMIQNQPVFYSEVIMLKGYITLKCYVTPIRTISGSLQNTVIRMYVQELILYRSYLAMWLVSGMYQVHYEKHDDKIVCLGGSICRCYFRKQSVTSIYQALMNVPPSLASDTQYSL